MLGAKLERSGIRDHDRAAAAPEPQLQLADQVVSSTPEQPAEPRGAQGPSLGLLALGGFVVPALLAGGDPARVALTSSPSA